MKMRKVLAIAAAAAVSLALLTSCGDSSSAETASSSAAQSSSEAKEPSEYDTTVFTVTVPDGWSAAPVADLLKKFDGKINPEQVYILKGGTTAEEIYKYPYIWVSYYKDANTYASAKSLYKDAEDISPLQTGDRTWEGYKYTSSGYPGTCLTSKDGNGLWVCLFVLENGDNKIAIEDEDVKTILSSLKIK